MYDFDDQQIREQVDRHRDLADALGVRASAVDAWSRLETADRDKARAELLALYRGSVEAVARDHITACGRRHCTECTAFRSVLAAGIAYDRAWAATHPAPVPAPRPSWDTITEPMEAPRGW